MKYCIKRRISSLIFHVPIYYILINNLDLDGRCGRVCELASDYLISMFCSC